MAASLWFASPQTAKALDIRFSSLPSSGTLGQTYTFSVTIDIQSGDVLPLLNAKLEIVNDSSGVIATCDNMPTNNGTRNYNAAETGNGTIAVTTSTNGAWTYGYGNRSINWGGTGYAVGYGYGYGWPDASITYSIVWFTPNGLAAGNYAIKITINGNSTFSKTSNTFALSRQTSGSGGSGGSSGGPSSPGITGLAAYTNSEGMFNLAAVAKSADGIAELAFAKGIQAKTRDRDPLKSVSIMKMADPPPAPADTTLIGPVYEFGPVGATFVPAATLMIHYDISSLSVGVDEKKLVIATWDATATKWVELPSSVDTMNRTISVSIEHLSVYTIFVHTRPAVLQISELTISPKQVDPGQLVNISVKVSNTGDLTGTYEINLKINGVSEAKKAITVPGGESQIVYFSTVGDDPGKYSIDANGVKGEFVVEPAVPSKATFSVSQLDVSPAEVDIGDTITISIIVTNISEHDGIYDAILKIDNLIAATKEISISAGASRTVSFATSEGVPGTYVVEIGDVFGSFKVNEVHSMPLRLTIWWLIGGIVAVLAAATMFVWLTIRRKAA